VGKVKHGEGSIMDMYAEVRSLLANAELINNPVLAIVRLDWLFCNYNPKDIFEWYNLKHYIIDIVNTWPEFNHCGSKSKYLSEIFGQHHVISTVEIISDTDDWNSGVGDEDSTPFTNRSFYAFTELFKISIETLSSDVDKIYEHMYIVCTNTMMGRDFDALKRSSIKSIEGCNKLNAWISCSTKAELEDKEPDIHSKYENECQGLYIYKGTLSVGNANVFMRIKNTKYTGILPIWRK
jgi:hypothetical protein